MARRKSPRRIELSPDEHRRLVVACQALGTTFQEFVSFATRTALDEIEGYGRDIAERRAFFDRLNTIRVANSDRNPKWEYERREDDESG